MEEGNGTHVDVLSVFHCPRLVPDVQRPNGLSRRGLPPRRVCLLVASTVSYFVGECLHV